jgi:hypothetical protein
MPEEFEANQEAGAETLEDVKAEQEENPQEEPPVEFSVEDGANALLGLFGDDEEEEEAEPVAASAEEEPAKQGRTASEEDTSVYTVVVDGEEMEVGESELVSGYQRQADYTRKTQELANQRREIEAEKQRLAVEREKYSKTLAGWEQTIDDQINQLESSMGQLRQDDPEQWAAAKERVDQLKDAKKRISEETTGVSEVGKKEFQEQFQNYLRGELQKLSESKEAKAVMPEYFDSAKHNDFIAEMRTYGSAQGFSEQEMGYLADHRLLIMLAKAKKYDQVRIAAANKGKRKVPKTPTRNAKGSARQDNAANNADYDKARKSYKRLLKTGSPRDAGKLLEQLY